jgi:hypothetical protein
MAFNYNKQGQQIVNSPNYNVNTNHPIIQNSQEYMFYKKYVSIHSEDRDALKYPNSSEFEIEFPEDLVNVASLRLASWTFPANYNTFSPLNSNITMTFKINEPYNTNSNNVDDLLLQKIFEFLYENKNNNYEFQIQEGFYNPQQMVIELTNKFNYTVTIAIKKYFTSQSVNPNIDTALQAEYLAALASFTANGGYQNFVIVYNTVSQKIWFGNICDKFILTNETQFLRNIANDNLLCAGRSQLPDYSSWGLPGNLGLSRCDTISTNGEDSLEINDLTIYDTILVPRFYFGDVYPGDDGYWLLPNFTVFPNSTVFWVECVYKINLMGPAYMYLEIEGHNCIDETMPYNVSKFTLKTNETNGIVNSSFAKIAIPTTPISQWFDRDSFPYKYYYPPAERMRKFKFKIRYHNGQLVNFGVFNYSFVIEFTLQMSQLLRSANLMVYPPPMGR